MRRVVWTDEAEAQLLRLAPTDADAIMRAIETLAERSIGFVRIMIPSDELRLYAAGCVATIVESEGFIHVLAVRKR